MHVFGFQIYLLFYFKFMSFFCYSKCCYSYNQSLNTCEIVLLFPAVQNKITYKPMRQVKIW
jgi:hypothetical protein